MVKEHVLVSGWAQLVGGIAGLLFFMMSGQTPSYTTYPILIYALVFIAMGYQHVSSKR